MKIIRVKVKTILLSAVMIFITIPYLMYFIGEVGYSSDIYINGNKLSTYTVGALKIYDNWPTIKFNKGKTNYLLGMSNYNYNEELLVSYTNGCSSFLENYGNKEQSLIAKSYFENGINIGENSDYYKYNINALINLEMTLGNNERALELIENAKASDEEEIWAVGILNEVVYYAKTGNYERALEICKENTGKIPILYRYINIISYMNNDLKLLSGNRINLFELNEHGYWQKKNIMQNSIIDQRIINDISFIKDIDITDVDSNKNEVTFNESYYESLKYGKISGTVVSKGEPVPNAKIGLNMESGIKVSSLGPNNLSLYSEEIYKEQVTYTNSKGEFIFDEVIVDTGYSIGVTLSSIYGDKVVAKRPENISIISVAEGATSNIDIVFNPMVNVKVIDEDREKDEIVVTYESVPEAAGYALAIGNNGMEMYTNIITSGNEMRVPLTKGSMQSFSIYTGSEGGELGIETDAKSLLGFINGEEISLGVIAYDSDGNLISKSKMWENKIKLKKKNLNEGEKLVLKGKEKEGYNWIYNKLLEEPMNEEYIYPIMRLSIEKKEYDYAKELINRLEEINKTGFDRANYEMMIDRE